MSTLSNWKKNKAKAVFTNTQPTLTDQAGARDTDINVIVAQFGIHGQVPQGASNPLYGDFTDLPNGLRESIEMARNMRAEQDKLPEQLRGLSIDELLALTPETLREKLTPVEKPTEPKKEDSE